MKHPQTPLGNALYSLAICLIVALVVIATDREVLQNPIRLSVLVVVAIGVPVGNYLITRRRVLRSNG